MSIEEQIGAKIRNLRNQNGLTQEELADRTELTKGFISQMERGLTAPSVSTLLDIVECLGTNLSDFFHEENELQIVYPKEDYFEKEDEHKNSITCGLRLRRAAAWNRSSYSYSRGSRCRKINLMRERNSATFWMERSVSHYGEDVYTVRKGDSFIFPANRKHKISSACKKVSSILWISSPPAFRRKSHVRCYFNVRFDQ